MQNRNQNSLLFLFEGDTEKEFYKKIFDLYIPKRKIQIYLVNLEGLHRINKKVKNAIFSYLDRHKDRKKIHVAVAYDREGPRNTPLMFNKNLILNELKKNNVKRVAKIKEIIATQDLESWLFNDLEGIYKFLRVPIKDRNLRAYPNIESTNNKTLSRLFHRYEKLYIKGRRVEGFLNKLDIKKIYNNTPDLQKGIEYIKSLC
jgi:Domain of unknown function (DUF4276)